MKTFAIFIACLWLVIACATIWCAAVNNDDFDTIQDDQRNQSYEQAMKDQNIKRGIDELTDLLKKMEHQ